MKKIVFIALLLPLLAFNWKPNITKIYLIGDSTVADYMLEDDYQDKRYPVAGWGQEFQPFFRNFKKGCIGFINTYRVEIDDRAKGGRSTRTFFQEGRWRSVVRELKRGDVVMIQFGHNDAAENKTERYVPIEGYKEFLRLYVSQTREKGATPILLTPVARNYPWKDEVLQNVHGEYPDAVKEIAQEMNVLLIDLNQLSMGFFSSKGQEFSTKNYFMNLEADKYKAYPAGQKDNTHFQPAEAKAVAKLVSNSLLKFK